MTAELQAAFTAELMGAVEKHARIRFRHVKGQDFDDRVAECLALAWFWFIRLHRQGKQDRIFPSVIADYAVRQVRSGRRLTGMDSIRDPMNDRCWHAHGATRETHPRDPFAERLTDNTSTPPDDAAAFRIDFPAWLGTLTPRDRELVAFLAEDARTMDAAERFGLTPPRISQLRREYKASWDRFTE